MQPTHDRNTQIDYLPDMKNVVLSIWRHRIPMGLTMAAVILVGSPFILFKTNTYDASSTIIIKDDAVNLADFKDITEGQQFDSMTVQTEVKILTSPTLALKTINNTKLYNTDEFHSSSGDARGSLSKFIRRLTVSQLGASKVIQIGFRSEDPVLAADVVNAYVSAYLTSQIDNKSNRIDELGKWFEERVGKLKTDLIKKSSAVSQYRAAQNLIVDQDDKGLVYQLINDTSAKLSVAQTRKLDIDSKLNIIESLKDTEQPNAIADIIGSPLIQKLKTEVSEAAQDLATVNGNFGPRHPQVRAAQSKLSQARRSLGDETLKIKDTLKSDALATQAGIDMFQARLVQLEKEANDVQAKMIILNSLKVEEDTSKRLLNSFVANYENIQSQDNLARSDATVISPAVASTSPSAPGKTLLFLALMIISGCLGLAVVFFLEVMRGGIGNFEDIRKFGYKPLGVLPTIVNPIFVAQSSQNSSYKEALKRIYMASLLSAKTQTLLITSALPNEGRTTFALSMAHYMRSIGHAVLVIDADFMNPTISLRENQTNVLGLTDYLTGLSTLDDIISVNDTGLSLIKAGTQRLPSPDILRSDLFVHMMNTLKQRFNFIIIDSSPLLAHAESETIARHVDSIIVITEWMKTSHSAITSLSVTLAESKSKVVGLVLNKVDIDKYKTFTSGSDFLLPNMTKADSN